MQYIGLLVIGAAVCCVGIVNLRGDVSTIHVYHRWTVSKENLARYSKLMGIGTLTAGLSVTIVAVAQMVHETEMAWWLLLAGVAVGFVLMVLAQFTAGGFLQQLRLLIQATKDKRR